MILAGINFSLHFQMLRGKPLIFSEIRNARFFRPCPGVHPDHCAGHSRPGHDSFSAALQSAAFQAVSILTTTGYATADYELFPGFSQVILFACMFLGASAGSTGGGIKIARLIVCFKFACRELFRLIHPPQHPACQTQPKDGVRRCAPVHHGVSGPVHDAVCSGQCPSGCHGHGSSHFPGSGGVLPG